MEIKNVLKENDNILYTRKDVSLSENGDKEILAMMEEFETNKTKTTIHLPEKFKLYLKEYEQYLKEFNGGSGMIGEESYLILWSQDEIVEFNRDYAVEEFLPNILLIGSDGGEFAYGINSKCEYIQVPFIPMDTEEVSVIARTFEEFIQYLYNR